MSRMYLLKMRFANGTEFSKEDIDKFKSEIDIFSVKAKSSRNPRTVSAREYNAQSKTMDVKLESDSELEYPGRSLAGFSRDLLAKYPEFKKGVMGTSLFRVEVINLSTEPQEVIIKSYNDMIKIIVDLVMESGDAKDRHKRDDVLEAVKAVLTESEYVRDNIEKLI